MSMDQVEAMWEFGTSQLIHDIILFMESIKIVQANIDKEKVTVDVIRTVETKSRTTPEYLKEQRQKLVESIANFQASIDKIDATLENIYAEINKK
jgi:hypothetical protein